MMTERQNIDDTISYIVLNLGDIFANELRILCPKLLFGYGSGNFRYASLNILKKSVPIQMGTESEVSRYSDTLHQVFNDQKYIPTISRQYELLLNLHYTYLVQSQVIGFQPSTQSTQC